MKRRHLLTSLLALGLLGASAGACSSKESKVCHATANLVVKVPVAELHGKASVPIELTIGDDGVSAPHHVKVDLTTKDGSMVVKTLLDADKPLGVVPIDFAAGNEKDLSTGAYALKADVTCPAGVDEAKSAQATGALWVARLGAAKITIKDGDGARLPLMYHAVDHKALNYFPIPDDKAGAALAAPADGEPDLDSKDGTPREFPAPWDDLETPPVDSSGAVMESGYSFPVSLKVGTKPDVTFTIGKTAAKGAATQATGLAADGIPQVRMVLDGVPGSDAGLVTEGGEVTLRLGTAPVPAVNRVDVPVKWAFEAKGADGKFVAIPDSGGQATLRFYGVFGNEQGTASPNLPWVMVVDQATKKIAGKANTVDDARAALVELIYAESDLTYDTAKGASAYTMYSGAGGWSAGTFSLGDFLGRKRGKVVNCSDCASILSTYSNMIGAKLHYAIIGWNFKLNAVLGIGGTDWVYLFGGGFSYHAVTSPDLTAHIFDATLALDGDDDPKAAPHTKRLVQNVTGSDYLTRLSPTYGTGTPDYKYNDQSTKVR